MSKPDWTLIRAEELDRAVGDMVEEEVAANHIELGDYEIVVLFKPNWWRSGGKEVAGKAALCGAQEKLLSDVDGVITLAWDWWDETATREQKVALLDHELSHFAVEFDDETGEATLTIVGHDVEEFLGVWERHGAWTVDLEKAEAQLRLPFGADEDGSAETFLTTAEGEEEDVKLTFTSPGGEPVETTVAVLEQAAEMVAR